MENKTMIEELYFCAAQCTRCYDACQIEKDKSQLEECMKLDEECADICRMTAIRLEKNSKNSDKYLKLCAEICESCAIECEKHTKMEHCVKCAEVCRKCAEMCLEPEHQ